MKCMVYRFSSGSGLDYNYVVDHLVAIDGIVVASLQFIYCLEIIEIKIRRWFFERTARVFLWAAPVLGTGKPPGGGTEIAVT